MINGVINVYKEPGYTSHDVVAKLRGILKQKKDGVWENIHDINFMLVNAHKVEGDEIREKNDGIHGIA